MGKMANTKNNPPKIGTRVKKETSFKKTVYKRKRLLMLRRRLSILLDEKESWYAKNQELMESLNKEKKLTSELQKEVFKWQRLYHESMISLNTYKVKFADMVQNLSSCLKDVNSTFPLMVGLSEVICLNKTKLTSQLNSLRAIVETESYIPKAFIDAGQANHDFSKKSEKRMKHKVGPMIKGVLIQKPTIRLERVMLQRPQEQEPANNERSPTGPNALTPVTEENEEETDLPLGQIAMKRRRKHRLGSADRWRMRKKEQLEKEQRERERENQRRSVVEESSDSDDHLGPVIRLQRLSGLLLSPKLLEVDRVRASEGKCSTNRSSESETHRLRASEDPMEGCSWMNMNSIHSKSKKSSEKENLQSPDTSDSSDEESETLNDRQQNARNSLMNTLYKTQSYTVRRKISSSSSTADTSREASDSTKNEPDSTNNIDEIVFGRSSPMGDSLDLGIASSVSGSKPVAYSEALPRVSRTQHERGSVTDSQTTSSDAPKMAKNPTRSSNEQRRSGFCNNCTLSSPEVQGKRIRKPKIHVYPGEESDFPKASVTKAKKTKPPIISKQKVSNSQLSMGRKSLGKSQIKTSMASAGTTTQSSPAANARTSQGRPSVTTQTKKVLKKSLKKSVDSSRNSSVLDQRPSQGQGDNGAGRSSRRTRVQVSYKESPLNVKMRRSK